MTDVASLPEKLPATEIAALRKLHGKGMVSAVGEYTPVELWDALDEIERLRALAARPRTTEMERGMATADVNVDEVRRVAKEMRTRMRGDITHHPKPVYGAELLEWADKLEASLNIERFGAPHSEARKAAIDALASPAPSAGVGVGVEEDFIMAVRHRVGCHDGLDITPSQVRAVLRHANIEAAAALQHPAAPSVSPAYDFALWAEMIEQPERYTPEARAEQVRLLREADNATGNAVTVDRSPAVAGEGLREFEEGIRRDVIPQIAEQQRRKVQGATRLLAGIPACENCERLEVALASQIEITNRERELAENCARRLASSAPQGEVAWYVFAGTEHWVTNDRDEAERNRAEGCQVRPLIFGDTTQPPAPDAEQGVCLCRAGAYKMEPGCKHCEPAPHPEARGVEDVIWRIDNEAEQFIPPKGMIYLRYLRDLLATSNPVRAEQPEGKEAWRWPFVESPGEFTQRLAKAMQEFSLLGAVRNVLIENPPTLSAAPSRPVVDEVIKLRQALEKLCSYNIDIRDGRLNYHPQDHIDVALAALGQQGDGNGK